MGAPPEGPSGQASGLIAVNAGGGLGGALPELDAGSIREEGPLAGGGEEWDGAGRARRRLLVRRVTTIGCV